MSEEKDRDVNRDVAGRRTMCPMVCEMPDHRLVWVDATILPSLFITFMGDKYKFYYLTLHSQN